MLANTEIGDARCVAGRGSSRRRGSYVALPVRIAVVIWPELDLGLVVLCISKRYEVRGR